MSERNVKRDEGTENAVVNTSKRVLSSEKREDLWAIIIAGVVLVLSSIDPDALYTFFKKSLFIF